MCGIFGMIGERFASDFDAALDALTHRGPDERGTHRDADVRLGHRRLSIIDLAGGHQPMATPDGRYTLVYNGELYNFDALRRGLEAEGIGFETHSDTEVVLRALARGGVEALAGFDGMFAFALWDAHERSLLLARDRMGVKPLFYAGVQGLVFASTLEPFWELRGFPRRLDHEALRDYLAYQYIPYPRTILSDIRALEPGAWLRWRNGRIETGRYWDIPAAQPEPMPWDELIEATDAALRESVRRQMVADVPLGAFLSGGIDSSLMVRYMADASSRPVKTFTVGFSGSRKHDESGYARQVARRFGTEHHELEARELDSDRFARAVAAMGQPLGDPAYLPTMALSELTREHVTVAIAGDGGDELFGGYHRYRRPESAYPNLPWHRVLRAGVESGLLPRHWHRQGLRGRDRVTRNHSSMADHPPAADRSLRAILTPEAQALLGVDRVHEEWRTAVLRWDRGMDSDALIRADLWHYLSANCLVKTDRASMSTSLEVRVPMLGNPVVDLILPQPGSVKLRDGLKSILMALARRDLPREVWDRRKHGFSVPTRDYICDHWRGYTEGLVNDGERLAPFFDMAEIRRRWALQCAGRRVDWPLYSIIVLLSWLSTHEVDH